MQKAITAYDQWLFPTIQTYDNHAIGIRINRISSGASPAWPSQGSTYPLGSNYDRSATSPGTVFILDSQFSMCVSSVGPTNFLKHDPDGDLCMPKKDFELTDAATISGKDGNGVSHTYDLYNGAVVSGTNVFSSLMAEIFQDTGATYEVWLTDYSGPVASPTTEVFFQGEIDYASIQFLHENIANEFTANAQRLMHVRFSANSKIISLKQKPGTGTPQPLTAQDLVDYIVGSAYGGTGSGATGYQIAPAFAGTGTLSDLSSWSTNVSSYSNTALYALAYIWTHSTSFPRAVTEVDIVTLLGWICNVAGLQASSIDTNMQFDFYQQYYNSSDWTLAKLADDWGGLYVLLNFLLGMPITDKPGELGTAQRGTDGVASGGAGAFSSATMNVPSDVLGVTIIISGVSYTITNWFAHNSIAVNGLLTPATGLTWSIAAVGYNSLFVQWGCSFNRTDTLDKLVRWICLQTGCFADYSIDTSGNFTLKLIGRRTQGSGIPTNWILLNGQSEEPTQIGKSSLIVQMIGDDLQALAGPLATDAVTINPPWRCHQWGDTQTATNGEGFTSQNFPELWWNQKLPPNQQPLSVTVDDKPNKDYVNDHTQDPTTNGWIGATMLYWKNPSVSTVPYPAAVQNPPTIGEFIFQAVAAILPAGMTPPPDSLLRANLGDPLGYYSPQLAYAQFYYQEIVGNKIVLKQRFRGCRDDSGKLQTIRPGMVMQTWLRGEYRTFIAHELNIYELLCITEVTWVEVLDYLSTLPPVSVIGQAGSSSSSTSSSSSSSGTGTASGLTIGNLTESLSANQNDWSLPLSWWTDIRISASVPVTITGLANGKSSYRVTITNTGANQIKLTNQDAASAAANRFEFIGISAFKLLGQNSSISFFYDSANSLWRELTQAV